MIVFSLNGECGISGIWSAITASKSFNTNLIDIKNEATHYVRYTTGGTAALQIGETLTGGTSAATAYLVGQAVENGTAGSGDSGVLFLRIISGTPTASGETWTGGTSTGTAVAAQAPITILTHGKPKSSLITVETASINFTLDGTTPTATAGTNYGHTVSAGQNFTITGWNNIRNFKCINAVASNGAIVKYSLFF